MVQQEIYNRIRQSLIDVPDYRDHPEVAERFNRLLLLLITFVGDRIDSQGARKPYLSRFTPGMEPHEKELQFDLHDFLRGHYEPSQLEVPNVSGGRTDIYQHFPTFRFVIEVKRTSEDWGRKVLTPFLGQSEAYQQTDIGLGVLIVLDLTDRPPGHPGIRNCFEVAQSIAESRTVLVVRMPGNKQLPSEAKGR